MPKTAKAYIAWVVGLGFLAVAAGLAQWQSADLRRYFVYLALAMSSSALKVRLPGMTGTYSLSFLFILLGIADFSFAETVVMGCLSTVVQCLWKAKQRPKFIQVLFNVSNIAISIAVAWSLARLTPIQGLRDNLPIMLALAASAYFVINTALVSGVLALVENHPFKKTWSQWFLWSFPYYLAGAAVAGLISSSARHAGWKSSLLALPLMYLIYCYYQTYVERHRRVQDGCAT